jgi:hypothetical protein
MVKYAREPANGPKSCKVRAPLPAATARAVHSTAVQLGSEGADVLQH